MSPLPPHVAHRSLQRGPSRVRSRSHDRALAPTCPARPEAGLSHARRRAAPIAGCLALCLWASACGSDETNLGALNPDGSFGNPALPSRDAGLDGRAASLDGGSINLPMVRVRFVHAIPNLGALLVCHDPDGAGPVAPDALREDTELLRADYGTRSGTVLVPALSTGTLTLQRDPSFAGVASGFDGGNLGDGAAGDAGSALPPCDPSLREATIPLPITGAWLAPSAPISDTQLLALDLLPGLSGASALTLFSSGVALNETTLDQRAASARASWLNDHPGDTEQADRNGMAERAYLQATFGARALIALDRSAASLQTFSLSVFHAIPDVAPADASHADREIGAVRLCVTAASLDTGVLPKPPAAGIPFRLRTLVGDSFTPGLVYDFRVFAQGAFDAKSQDCSTTSLLPLAKQSFSNFLPGHAYTLALFGAVAPVTLCSANDVSLARASCSRPAADLGAHIELLVD